MLHLINRSFFILFIIFLLHDESSTTSNNNVKIEKLPKTTLPISYEIKLIPQIIKDNFTFDGESKIFLKVLKETSNVTLHSKNLWIDENFTNLIDINGIIHKAKKHSYVEATSFLVIEFNQPIMPGNYILNLKYAGKMNDGIYNSSYVSEKDEKISFIATSFGWGKARSAFPCWDEFNLKATFNLSIKHYPNVTAVSNMPVRNEFLDTDGKIWTNFITTPLMSVYRLGFVVSDFVCLRNENKNLSFCGRKTFLPYLKHPLEVTDRAIGFLEKYIDFAYNLPKYDQFAIPAEEEYNEIRRWKSIKYKEADFKHDNMLFAIGTGALSVVQEVTGDWIGNLLTLNTSRSAWIVEGLSIYLGYYVTDKLFPDWRQMDIFFIANIENMNYFTASEVSYGPLEKFPDDPSELTKNPVKLYRGAILFNTLSNILSENTFREGIRKFIHQNQTEFVNSDNLWNAFQLAYDENNKKSNGSLPIKEIMNSWVQEILYPIINVRRDYETGKVIITQEKLVSDIKTKRYWVPINFATESNPNFERTTPTHWLKPEDESLIIDGIDKDDWIIVNIQQSGYYRVDYDETNWNRIAEYMNTEKYRNIHVRNRAQLLDDLYKMTTINRQNYTTFLNLVQYLVREDDYLPWIPTIRRFHKLRRITYGSELDEIIRKFFLGLMKKVTEKIDFKDNDKYYETRSNNTNVIIDPESKIPISTEKYYEKLQNNDTFFENRYRDNIKCIACSLGHPLCTKSKSQQTQAFHIHHPLHYEVQMELEKFYSTYCDEIVTNSEDELLKMLAKNAMSLEYVNYLACSPDENAVRKFVVKVLTGELNASMFQLSRALLYLIIESKNTLDNNIEYFIENFEAISEYFENKNGQKKSKSEMKMLLNLSIEVTYTSEQLEKLIDLAKKLSNGTQFQRTINNKKESIKWRNDHSSEINKWFNDHSFNVSSALQ